MPTLNWIGKKDVSEYVKKVPFHLLQINPNLTVGDTDFDNLLIQGDNLTTLKALLPFYTGKVKCIYIDPPYNTGKEKWIYNDAVNSPEMKEWLGKVVGNEKEDLSRHDKWLCMMYPRLLLAKKFLSDDGVIFISIDDHEIQNLRLLMDNFWGSENLLSCFIWQTEGNFDNQAKVKIAHEYVLAYANDITKFPLPKIIDPNIPETSKLFNDAIINTIIKNGPKNPVSEIVVPIGFPASFKEGIIEPNNIQWPQYSDSITVKDFKVQNAVIARSGWSSKQIFESFIKNDYSLVYDSKNQLTRFVLTSSGAIEAIKERTGQSHVISVIKNVGSTQQASTKLSTMGIKFDYPKPVGLIKYILSMINNKDFLVMDFFAGSGTTAQAVLEMNKEDIGTRNFILIEIDSEICRSICYKRIKMVVEGYKNQKTKQNETGLGSGFKFCDLGMTLFDGSGQIRNEVSFEDLAKFVYFSETGEPLPKILLRSPLLGIAKGVAVYLLYNGILKDKSLFGGNVLTHASLNSLPKFDGPKVIYGAGCMLSESYLRRNGISFHQTPYEIRVS